MTPKVRHWIPTQERGIVLNWIHKNGPLPDNLVVRVSAAKINGDPSNSLPHTSNVVTGEAGVKDHKCPSLTQGNKCGDCRACWDKNVRNVSYVKH